MDQFLGVKYKLKSSENFDEYLQFIGVGYVMRRITASVSPICVLTKDDNDKYTLSMITVLKTAKLSFNLDEEFIEVKPDGVEVKSLLVANGNILMQIDTQMVENGRKSTILREFTPDTLIETITAEGWSGKCVRRHEVVK